MTHTLYSTVVNLTATQAGQLPATQGRLAQAAFLDIIKSVDPDLSAALHVKNQRRPYTVSPLRGLGRADRSGQMRVKPGDNLWLRFTLLGSELFSTFTQFLLMKNGRQAMPSLRLGEIDFAISEMLTTPGSHDWAGYTRLVDLWQGWSAADPPRRITLEFASPTAFSRNSDKDGMGKFMEFFPSSAMLFGSLAARWNELVGTPPQPPRGGSQDELPPSGGSQVELPPSGGVGGPEPATNSASTSSTKATDISTPSQPPPARGRDENLPPAGGLGGLLTLDKKAVREYAEETVVVGMYKMEARQFRYWGKPQIGAVGRVTYHLKDGREREMLCLLNLLADFAFYCGVGAKTAMGMGQVRRIDV